MTTTLLSLVQDILYDINGDEVNSISDTVESETVARHIKFTYENMLANRNWPHTRTAVGITARADSNFPSHMILNDDVKELISIRYDTRNTGETQRKYKKVNYLDPDEFLYKLSLRNNDNTNVDIVTDDSGIELLIVNNKHPEWFTSFDETNLIFDSYDSGIDSTLQESKIQALGFRTITLAMTDASVIDLPDEAIPALRETTITRVNFKDRGMEDPISASESTRQQRWLSRKAWRAGGGTKYPDFGR